MPVPPASPPLRDRGESRLGRPPPAGSAAGPRAHVLPAPAAAAPAPGVRVSIPAPCGFPRPPAPLEPGSARLHPRPARSPHRQPAAASLSRSTELCGPLSAPGSPLSPSCPASPSLPRPPSSSDLPTTPHSFHPFLPSSCFPALPCTPSRPSHSAAFPSHHPGEFHFPAPALPRGAPELSAAPSYPGAEERGFGAGGAIPRPRDECRAWAGSAWGAERSCCPAGWKGAAPVSIPISSAS